MTKIRTNEQFNTQLRVAVARLIADAARLKVTPANLAALAVLYGDLVTAGTWCFVWELYAGGDATCTPNVKKAIRALRKQIENLLSDIYDDIPASIWNDDDRSIFGRATGAHAAPTKPGQITEQCLVSFTQYGGGKMKVACRYTTDQTRPSKPANANALEIAGRIDIPLIGPTEVPIVIKDGAGNDLASKVRFVALANAEDGTTKSIYTKASFTINLDSQNIGNYLQVFARWINTKYPELAGPWTGPFVVLIS